MTFSNIKYSLVCMFAFIAFSATANTTNYSNSTQNAGIDTLELHVEGVCGMCQSRIELAVYDLKGVKKVDWDLESGQLTAIVKSGKVTRQQIADKLAEVGHDSELAKAKPEAYKELPGCCKYNDGVPKHNDGDGQNRK